MLHLSNFKYLKQTPDNVNFRLLEQLTVKMGLLTKDSYVHVDVGNSPLAEFG